MPLIDIDVADAYETSALPGVGDVNAGGGGIDTSALTNEAALASYGLDVESKAARGGAPYNPGSASPGWGRTVDSSGNIYDSSNGQKVGRAITPNMSTTAGMNHPVITLFLIIVVLAIMKFTGKEEHEDEKSVKISVFNTFRITMMAMLGFLILKWFFSVYVIASVSPTIEFV